MSRKPYKSCILLYTFCVIVASVDLGYANPLTTKQTIVTDDPITESLEEFNEFNENEMLRDSASMAPSNFVDVKRNDAFTHVDEDSAYVDKLNDILGKMKKDVEILQSNEPIVVKDKDELEELYRGPSIVIKTDEFINENIEMNGEDEAVVEIASRKAISTSHLILSGILVLVALMSIGLYAGLVMWRRHIEQRYGMCELLVTNDNQDYWPQNMTDLPAMTAHTNAQQQQQ